MFSIGNIEKNGVKREGSAKDPSNRAHPICPRPGQVWGQMNTKGHKQENQEPGKKDRPCILMQP